jgi:hypothetical protein
MSSSTRPPRAPRRFSYDEALATFPLVRDLTADAVARAAECERRLSAPEGEASGLPESSAPVADVAALEEARRSVVEDWVEEISSLGCVAKGLWLVDWDCGDGYYCWRYPEQALAHFHGYDEGFAGRVPVQ